LGKERGGVKFLGRARLFVFARLLQVNAVAGAVDGNFAGFAATLGANTVVQGGAKTLLFPGMAKGATHEYLSPAFIITSGSVFLRGAGAAVEASGATFLAANHAPILVLTGLNPPFLVQNRTSRLKKPHKTWLWRFFSTGAVV
jgi:hypothetical protein